MIVDFSIDLPPIAASLVARSMELWTEWDRRSSFSQPFMPVID
jgi:hypothetical protein